MFNYFFMNDLICQMPEKLIQLQRESMLAKTPYERAAIGIEITNTVYATVKANILNEHPQITSGELIGMIFERYYRNNFSSDKINEIKQAIINCHNKA